MNAEPLTLELLPAELERLTKRTQPAAQCRVLAHYQIPHRRHPIDGSVIVGREAAARALGEATDNPGAGREPASNQPDGFTFTKAAR